MKKIWGIIYGLLLTAFTVYVLMDTFVIARVYTPGASNSFPQNIITELNSILSREKNADAAENNADSFENNVDDVENNTDDTENNTDDTENNADVVEPLTALYTEDTYEDDNISITLTYYREYETNIHVAEIQLSSAEYLKTALAQGVYGQNVKARTSEIAQENNAIFAVNGDYYGAHENSYVVRNGVLYRNVPFEKNNREDLVIYKDGSFSLIAESEVSAEQLLAAGAEQVLSFGPALIKDGRIAVSDKSKSNHPRTGIGLIDDLHYLFVVTDGRIDGNRGLTYHELAEFMYTFGVKEAYNLDGGGSSAMYLNGKTINTLGESERRISDIIYIGY